MAGGLGFVHHSGDRFPPLDLLWWITRLEQVGWPVELADGSVKPFEVGAFETEMLALAARRGFRIGAAKVSTIYGDEVSKIHPVRDTLRFYKLLGRLKREAA